MYFSTVAAIEAAQSLKNQGITLIAVGIGKEVNEYELKTIASDPSYYSAAKDFTNLDFITRDLVKLTCDGE